MPGDLSHLSDEQLAQIASGKSANTGSPDLSHLSDDQLHAIANQKPSMSQGNAAVIQGENGATLGLRPVVAGLGAAAGAFSGTNAPFGSRLAAAKDAFIQGRSDANAEQNQAMEQYPKTSIAANIGGSALSLPLLPAKGFSGAVKLGAGLGAAQAAGSADSLPESAADIGGGAVLGAGGSLVGKGASKLAGTDLVQGAVSKVKGAVGSGASKLASALTGIPDKEIETLATQTDKLGNLIKESGGDVSIAANIQRQNIQNAVKQTKDALNSQISSTLQAAPQDKVYDILPIAKKMQEVKSQIDPALYPEAHKEIDELITRISKVGDNTGTQGRMKSIQDLQQIKGFLGDQAAGAWNESPLGFQVSDKAARAAKSAYMETKSIMDKYGPEEIKNANRQLSQLHDVEEHVNKNLVLPGKPEGPLLSVGSGVSSQNSIALNNLDKLTGGSAVPDSNLLSTMRTFGPGASWKPYLNNGKSLLLPGMGAAVGSYIDPDHTKGAAAGFLLGGAISSPAALKLAINTGKLPMQAVSKVASYLGVNPQNYQELSQLLQKPQVQELFMKTLQSNNNQAAASQKPSNVIKTRTQLGL